MNDDDNLDDGLATRSFDFLLQLRDDGDGRTLIGRAVPYGPTANIPGGRERFVLGAFARQIAANKPGAVKMYASHADRLAGNQPIGKTSSMSEMVDGLHGSWPLYNTSKANDSLELVRAGEITGLSVGFRVLPGGTKRAADGALERRSAHLDHVVLTHEPAYADAGILAVRSAGSSMPAWRRDQLRHRQILERLAVPL